MRWVQTYRVRLSGRESAVSVWFVLFAAPLSLASALFVVLVTAMVRSEVVGTQRGD